MIKLIAVVTILLAGQIVDQDEYTHKERFNTIQECSDRAEKDLPGFRELLAIELSAEEGIDKNQDGWFLTWDCVPEEPVNGVPAPEGKNQVLTYPMTWDRLALGIQKVFRNHAFGQMN